MSTDCACPIHLYLGIHAKKPEGHHPKLTTVNKWLILMPVTRIQTFYVQPLKASVDFAHISLGATIFQASPGLFLACCPGIERAPQRVQ